MSNVTRALELVKEVDVHVPPAGTQLVVFRQTRYGDKFYKALKPGQELECSLLDRLSSFRLLAVSAKPSERHEFSQSYLHKDQVHNFDLHFTLDFRVADAEQLVKYRDPVLRLQKEVERLVGGAVQALDWQEIEEQRVVVGRHALASKPPGMEEQGQTAWNRLCRFAEEHGLRLENVEVTCRVGETSTRRATLMEEEDFERERLRQKQATKRVERMGDLELQFEEQRIRGRTEALQNAQKRSDEILDQLKKAVTQVASGVNSASGLKSAVLEMAETHRQLQEYGGAFSPGMQAGEVRGALGASGVPGGRLALEEGTGPLQEEGELLGTLLEQLASLDLEPSRRRRLLGQALHLLGEALQGNAADSVEIDGRISRMQELVDLCRTDEQHAFFASFCNRERLRRWA